MVLALSIVGVFVVVFCYRQIRDRRLVAQCLPDPVNRQLPWPIMTDRYWFGHHYSIWVVKELEKLNEEVVASILHEQSVMYKTNRVRDLAQQETNRAGRKYQSLAAAAHSYRVNAPPVRTYEDVTHPPPSVGLSF